MIIIKFQGRLGNQMFQYAFALSTARKLGTFFLLDRLRKSTLLQYFEIKYISLSPKFNDYFIKKIRKILRKKIYQNNFENVEDVKNRIENNRYYQGYFHSESYFTTIPDLVKKRLQIRKKYKEDFKAKYGIFFKKNKVVAIHCRLGDYLTWGNEQLGGKDLTLPQSYFRNAIHKIKNIEEYKIIIVTDDPQHIKDRFDFVPEKLIVAEDEIIDFQILQNAHKVIVSNSSFSWWAAYLNNKSATIYAPEYWLGFKINKEIPKSILPESWIKVRCDYSYLDGQ